MEEINDDIAENPNEPTLVGCEVTMKDPNGDLLKGVISKVTLLSDGTKSLEMAMESGKVMKVVGAYPISYKPDMTSCRAVSMKECEVELQQEVIRDSAFLKWLQRAKDDRF